MSSQGPLSQVALTDVQGNGSDVETLVQSDRLRGPVRQKRPEARQAARPKQSIDSPWFAVI